MIYENLPPGKREVLYLIQCSISHTPIEYSPKINIAVLSKIPAENQNAPANKSRSTLFYFSKLLVVLAYCYSHCRKTAYRSRTESRKLKSGNTSVYVACIACAVTGCYLRCRIGH